MANLVLSVEELAGQAIAATQRDKRQQQTLEMFEERLAALEKSTSTTTATFPGDVTMQESSPPSPLRATHRHLGPPASAPVAPDAHGEARERTAPACGV